MAKDELSFLNVEEPVEDETEVEAAAPEPEPEGEQAAPEAEAEAPADKGEEPAPPAEPAKDDSKSVPLAVVQAEREKRQRLERELEQLRAQQAQAPKDQPKPDYYADPEGVLNAHAKQTHMAMLEERKKISRFMAEKDFGPELVQEAFEYFDRNPSQSVELLNHPSPFHAAVEHYKKAKMVDEITTDPDAYRARIIAEWQQEQATQLQQAQRPKPAAPPKSLATSAAIGGEATPPVSGLSDILG